MPFPTFITEDALQRVVGFNADADRVTLATGAAQGAMCTWTDAENVPAPEPATGPQMQAALEAAVTFYHRQAAPGGLTSDGADLVSQLPADVARRIRDLLEVDADTWGFA